MAKSKGGLVAPKLRLPASSLSTTTAATAGGAAPGDGTGTEKSESGIPNICGGGVIPEGGGNSGGIGFEMLEPLSPPTGDTIPTPEIISHRKASIHVQSKLVSSPQ